jgi:hypothetical protein
VGGGRGKERREGREREKDREEWEREEYYASTKNNEILSFALK